MIICCGEALIDMLPRNLGDGSNVYLPVPGGAVFNTAIALGRLGESAGFVSGLSTDMFGDLLVDALAQSNVSNEFCSRIDKPTTMAFVKLVDGHAQYSFMDENSANRSLQPDHIRPLPAELEAMHFGAISLIPEPCGSTYEALQAQYHERAVISLDPNIRPGFITDEGAHRGRIERMIALSDIVKVSDEDLDWIAPGQTHNEAISGWLAGKTSVVVLTKGAEGCELFTISGSIDVAAQKVDVVDTVGAGDVFNAGFLSGLKSVGLLSKNKLATAELDKLAEAAGLGIKAAAFTVGQAGAVPPWRSDLSL